VEAYQQQNTQQEKKQRPPFEAAFQKDAVRGWSAGPPCRLQLYADLGMEVGFAVAAWVSA